MLENTWAFQRQLAFVHHKNTSCCKKPYTPTVNKSEDMVTLFSLCGVKEMITFKPFSSNASFAFAGLNARG